MKYKALFLDVDGTLVPYDYGALPSDKVTAAVKKAQEKLTVCLVTGRGFSFTQAVLKKLNLHSGYTVVNTGALVVDIETQEIVHEQPLNRSDAEEIVSVLHDEKIEFFMKRSFYGDARTDGPFTVGTPFGKAYMIFTDDIYEPKKIEKVFSRLSHLSEINPHMSKHKHPDKFGINIGHIKATKLHGVQILFQKLGLKKEEVIGVGDSYNDFPLLMASGLKVAMGNAIDDLKEIADYVAPSVTEDGVADVIEKFILPE